MRGIHRWLVDSLHKQPVTPKMFPFDDVTLELFVIDRLCELYVQSREGRRQYWILKELRRGRHHLNHFFRLYFVFQYNVWTRGYIRALFADRTRYCAMDVIFTMWQPTRITFMLFCLRFPLWYLSWLCARYVAITRMIFHSMIHCR